MRHKSPTWAAALVVKLLLKRASMVARCYSWAKKHRFSYSRNSSKWRGGGGGRNGLPVLVHVPEGGGEALAMLGAVLD